MVRIALNSLAPRSRRAQRVSCLLLGLTACAAPQFDTPSSKEPALDAGSGTSIGSTGSIAPPAPARPPGIDTVGETSAPMPAAPDAGTGDAMAPPAPPTTSVPSWASSLVGRYAVQTVVFGTSSQNSKSITRQQELAIAEVRGEGAEMRLRLKLCASHTENALGTVDLLQPEAYPEIERRVVFDGTTWGTDDGPLAIGYTRAPSAECVANPGGLFPKVAAQSWLESTCRCPLNEGTVPLFDDCRVSDPDGDGKPGLSYRVDIRGFVLPPMRQGMYNLYVAFSERTHFTQGRVDAAGVPTATVRSDSVFTQLGVDPSTGLGDFSRGGKPCDASFNRASFVRLAGEREGWTCAELRKQEATLYPSSRPSPSSCFAVSVTDDPER